MRLSLMRSGASPTSVQKDEQGVAALQERRVAHVGVEQQRAFLEAAELEAAGSRER